MRNKKLQGQVTAGRWTLPIVVFICTLCWVLISFLLPDLTASTVEDSTLSPLAIRPRLVTSRMG